MEPKYSFNKKVRFCCISDISHITLTCFGWYSRLRNLRTYFLGLGFVSHKNNQITLLVARKNNTTLFRKKCSLQTSLVQNIFQNFSPYFQEAKIVRKMRHFIARKQRPQKDGKHCGNKGSWAIDLALEYKNMRERKHNRQAAASLWCSAIFVAIMQWENVTTEQTNDLHWKNKIAFTLHCLACKTMYACPKCW